METINKVLTKAKKQLNKNNINSVQMDAELLLSHVLSKPRSYILGHQDFKLNLKQINKYQKLIDRRSKHEPVAYLVGYKEFYGINFTVNPNVLIPRPETELIIDEIIYSKPYNSTIIDLGTGSGCIIIALTKYLNNRINGRQTENNIKQTENNIKQTENNNLNNNKFIGIDISKKALITAKHNAKKYKLNNIEFIQGNLLEPILNNQNIIKNIINNNKHSNKNDSKDDSKNDNKNNNKINNKDNNINNEIIITANLPYLDSSWKNLLAFSNSAGLKYEPKIALEGGLDGLNYYRQLSKQLPKLKKLTKKPITIYCEIYKNQEDEMKTIFNFAKYIETKNDLAGLSRLVIIKI